MFNFPERPAFRIVIDALARQLRRAGYSPFAIAEGFPVAAPWQIAQWTP